MNLENVLFDVSVEIRKYQVNMANKFVDALKTFEKTLKKSDSMDRGYIIDMYYDELVKIKHFLVETKKAEFRAYHDRIFNHHLKLPHRTPKKVTLLFQEFIKGITYFEYQKNLVNDIPIYHRLYSCGDGTEIYRNDNIVCLSGIGRIEKNRRKKLAERCYLERLIYDALYKYETLHFPVIGTDDHSQDEGHLFRLDISRKDYESCFKDCQINVEIEWVDGIPCKLTIVRLKKNKETSREIYIKSYTYDGIMNKVYEPVVDCIKIVDGKEYHKYQTFKKEVDFTKHKI